MTGLSPPIPVLPMAHAGKAQVLMRQGDVAERERRWRQRRTWLPAASEREASHIGLFELVFAGRTDAAIAAMYAHLTAWPRDALVVSSGANPNGLIGGSGRIGQKHQIAELMDSLAPHYGDDFWFMAYHAMALSEDGQLAEARAKIERSVAINPNNAHGAHGFAHVCYESGEPDTARAYLAPVARHLSAGRVFLWPPELAPSRCARSRPAIGKRRCGCIRTPSRLTGTAAGRSRKCQMGRRFCGVPNSPAILAMPRPGAACTSMRTARCRGRAAGSPICT